jgi:predicted phosphodiesterase
VIDPLTTPARIAFVGDWHANTAHAVDTIEHLADRADVLIHLGDYGYTFTKSFCLRVDLALRSAGLPLLFVDGNHEDHTWLHRRRISANGLRPISDHVWHLPRGFRWEWGGVRFLALGGAYSVDRQWRVEGQSWWRQEEITPQQVRRTIERGPTDVLVAHDCPAGVAIPGLDQTAHLFPRAALEAAGQHRQLLRHVVDAVRPRWIWHGHYHCRYTTTVDLGYGPVTVTGLDMDGAAIAANVQIVDLADLIVRATV